MSFLDEQASGQIGIGEKANLGTLTRTRRKRKKGQRPQGTETYSLLPQNEFTDIVSSPTDITQVGIGQLLTAQGIPASQVRNVFERYQDTGAAPIGDVGDVLYPQPEDDGDDESYADGDIETETDPYIPDPGLPDFTDPDNINFDSRAAGLDAMSAANVPLGLEANAARYDEDGNRITGIEAILDSINPFSKGTSRAATTGGASGTSLAPLPPGGRTTLTPIANFDLSQTNVGGTLGPGSQGTGSTTTTNVGTSQFGFNYAAPSNTGGTSGPATAGGIGAAASAAAGGDPGVGEGPSGGGGMGGAGAGGAGFGSAGFGSTGYSGGYSGDGSFDFGTDADYGRAKGGVITKSKAKNKNSFMSMKGK